ncbi:MAG: GFA family protein [Myxococcota bacterium]
MNLQPVHPGSCHCGRVRFEVDLPDGLVDPRHCTCSMCRRRGAIVATARLDQLRIVDGADHLRVYQFNTGTARHYFCPTCGIYTHHQRRSNPALYGFNVGCLEGVDPFEIDVVEVYDGVLHPTDDARGGRLIARRRRESVP